MATTYKCDNCEVTATSLVGWLSAAVAFFHDEAVTGPPGGRIFDGANPQFVFHEVACRDAWCERVGVEPPPPAVVPEAVVGTT